MAITRKPNQGGITRRLVTTIRPRNSSLNASDYAELRRLSGGTFESLLQKIEQAAKNYLERLGLPTKAVFVDSDGSRHSARPSGMRWRFCAPTAMAEERDGKWSTAWFAAQLLNEIARVRREIRAGDAISIAEAAFDLGRDWKEWKLKGEVESDYERGAADRSTRKSVSEQANDAKKKRAAAWQAVVEELADGLDRKDSSAGAQRDHIYPALTKRLSKDELPAKSTVYEYLKTRRRKLVART